MFFFKICFAVVDEQNEINSEPICRSSAPSPPAFHVLPPSPSRSTIDFQTNNSEKLLSAEGKQSLSVPTSRWRAESESSYTDSDYMSSGTSSPYRSPSHSASESSLSILGESFPANNLGE